jgi:uncharacterized membrane protein YsdA (DUF1294 family)/cold shock CspA family protein
MRGKGKISSWNDEKGYGFIAPASGGSRVFVHIKAFGNRARRPAINDVVTYNLAADKQGRARAEGATLAGDKLKRRTKRNSSVPTILVALFFLAGASISAFATNLPLLIPAAYIFVSGVTFLVYAFDKSAARSGRWRTSETTLHLLALAGGWPGALVAQQTLRHKSKKASFRRAFFVIVLLNCAALVWLHTSTGRTSLVQLLATIHESAPGGRAVMALESANPVCHDGLCLIGGTLWAGPKASRTAPRL